MELTVNAALRGNRVVPLGLSSSPATFIPLRLVRAGVTIEPSLIYDDPADFERTVGLVARGVLQPSAIMSDTFECESIGRALELASTGQAGKIHTVMC